MDDATRGNELEVGKSQLEYGALVRENRAMSKVEHTGKEWSSSFLTGRETRKLFRWVEKASGAKIAAVGSFVGRLLDIVSGEEVGILRCGWLDNGDIEVIFPNMGVGRYVIAIDYTSQAGEVSRFLDGYAGYLEPRYVIEHQEQGEDIIITVCGSGDGREVMALAGDMVKYSAEEAIEAAKSAKNAQNEVENLLKQAIAFKESFDKALQDSITVSNNYLYVGGVNTGNYLKGDKGITPHIGADGYWYEGENRLGDRPAFGKDGITPSISADGYWVLGNKVTTVRAIGRDGLDGTAVRRVLIESLDELPAGEERGVFYYHKIGEKQYDVYAWLAPDGWTNIKEASDIATADNYGIMKYGTDVLVDGGAPLGRNAEGQASVPLAGIAVAGTGKLGTSTVLTEGGMVGMNATGNMMVPVATYSSFGAAKLSTSGALTEANSGEIGHGPRRGLRAKAATESSFGTVKLGSKYGQSNPSPYLVGIGATSDGRLANNYAFGGALQHRKPGAWQGTMSWLDAQISGHPEYFGDMFYSGLLTTDQFTQSSGHGLELLEATNTRLAGVYIANSMSDTRPAAVPTGGVVVNYLSEHYYGKSQVYTREETETQIGKTLNNYASIQWVQDNYMTRTSIMEELKKKLNCQPGVAENIVFISASDFAKLPTIDPLTAYEIYAG